MLVRIVIAVVWLGLALAAFPFRIPRSIVAIVSAMALCGYVGMALFVLADLGMDKITHVRMRGSSLLGPVGFVLGLIAGIAVGRIAGRTGWLYWVMQVSLAALVAFWH